MPTGYNQFGWYEWNDGSSPVYPEYLPPIGDAVTPWPPIPDVQPVPNPPTL